MNALKVVFVLAPVLICAACQNVTVDFDKLPNGTPVQPWTGGSGPVPPQYVISTEYSSVGVSFASGANGVAVLPAAPLGGTSPNAACPLGAGNLLNYGETTRITLSGHTCDVWVTIPPGLGLVTVATFDASGNPLRSETTSGSQATSVAGGTRVHVNACDIVRVELSGSNYCFDDFTYRDP